MFFIVAVVAIASYGTMAFLGDEAVSPNQVLGVDSDGVVIELGGDGNESSAYFNVSDMIPGQTVTKKMVIMNPARSLNSLFRAYINQTRDDIDLANRLHVKITLNPSESGYDAPTGYTKFNGSYTGVIYDDLLSGLVGSGNWRKLSSFTSTGVSTPIAPAEAAIYKIEVKLDPNVGNDYKSKIWKGDIIVQAVQYDNQPTGSDSVVDREEVVWN